MIEIVLNDNKYELIKNEREGFNAEELKSKMTDFFDIYTYIVGDWAYGKLRLKGFYDSKDKNVKDLNNFVNVDNYLKNNCAFGCRYFIIKKVDKK